MLDFHPTRTTRAGRRILVAGLAACAVAPGAASAMPIMEAQSGGVAPAQDLRAPDSRVQTPSKAGGAGLDLRAPDQVHGGTATAGAAARTTVSSPADDGGIDTGVWIACGAAGLLAAGGVGMAGRMRVRHRTAA